MGTLPLAPANAEDAGKRSFPATVTIEEPGVEDELSFPIVSSLRKGGSASARQTDLELDLSKRLTESFSVIVHSGYSRLQPGGSGFQNFESTFKHQFLTDPAREFIMSAGLAIAWGHTGARRVGAESFTTLTPQIYFGKGFGDLPAALAFARPFAITGQIGYSVPGSAKRVTVAGLDDDNVPILDIERHPRAMALGFTLQYPMAYLKENVVDLGLPEFIDNLTPIVEVSVKKPLSGNLGAEGTTGTVNPGLIWTRRRVQITAEAIVPLNRQSGRHVGVIGQLSYFFGDETPPERDAVRRQAKGLDD